MSQPGEATSAGIYAAVLKDPDTYPADRAAAEELLRVCPELADRPGRPGLATVNRDYLGSAVLLALNHLGIGQVLDLGCGYPAGGSVLESVLDVSPAARVACVDNDPDIASPEYGYPAVLAERGIDRAAMVLADLADPDAVMGHEAVARLIDFSRPVLCVLGAVLHYWPPAVSAGIVAGYTGRLPAGSAAAITVVAIPDRDRYETVRDVWTATTGLGFEDYHSDDDTVIGGLFAGLEVLHPKGGAGPVSGVRVAGRACRSAYLAGGIAVKEC